MLALAARRVGAWLALLGSVGLAGAIVMRLLPGAPPGLALDDRLADAALVARAAAAEGLDAPLWVQVLRQAAALLEGDLGRSYRYADVPVATIIGEAMPATLTLVAGALALAAAAGLAAGTLSAVHRGRPLDRLVTIALTACLALPLPAAAALAIQVGVFSTGLLPPVGWGGPQHAVLPVLVLALPAVGQVGRWSRVLLVEMLERPFIRQARAKGLSMPAVVVRHALPHAAGPLLTLLALLAGAMVGGAAVVEAIFAVPGLGRLAVEALRARDYPLAVMVAMTGGAVYATALLAADLLTAWIDPRRRDAGGTGRAP